MSYISGFVVAVPTEKKEAYLKMAAEAAELFKEYGATEIMEAWGENVPDGKVTDFKRAVQATEDETVVFSWVVWPSKETANEADRRMMEDNRMKMEDMPFDGKRMIYGGFEPILEVRA
jgi:uncharacterized protein YbaA (DUF1428 family)